MAKKKANTLKKTNDERILEQHKIAYEELNFDWINQGQQALQAAKEVGITPKSMLKTIVLNANKDPKDYLVICLPLEEEIDLKLVAQALGKKQVHLADNKNLINITGYVHGENTPIGISVRKGFPIYFDEKIKSYPEISVSAGKIGRSVRLKQADLVTLVNGKYLKVNNN